MNEIRVNFALHQTNKGEWFAYSAARGESTQSFATAEQACAAAAKWSTPQIKGEPKPAPKPATKAAAKATTAEEKELARLKAMTIPELEALVAKNAKELADLKGATANRESRAEVLSATLADHAGATNFSGQGNLLDDQMGLTKVIAGTEYDATTGVQTFGVKTKVRK